MPFLGRSRQILLKTLIYFCLCVSGRHLLVPEATSVLCAAKAPDISWQQGSISLPFYQTRTNRDRCGQF